MRWMCNSEDYATIDNAEVAGYEYSDLSCTSSETSVPAGWRLADWDADVAYVSGYSRYIMEPDPHV